MRRRKRRTSQRNRREECDESDPAERELFDALTPEQWRKHKDFVKRRDEFNVLSWSEQTDMARAVLAMDCELAQQVMRGTIQLFEAHHQLKEAEAFLNALKQRGLIKRGET
jgi:hypothetical protein